jgi:AraC-like DNA-binding protein
MSKRRSKHQPATATLRVGGASAIPAVLRDFGVDPDEVLTKAGIDPKLFDDPDNLITYSARGCLMKHCVAATGCQHFGLLVGKRMNLQSLGLVGLLMKTSPDASTALRGLINCLHLHSQGAVMTLNINGNTAVLTYDALQPEAEATDQIGDGSVAMMLNVMRTLCGPEFKPIEASFAHKKPVDIKPFRRFFRAPLFFDAGHFALAFSRNWLDTHLASDDTELHRMLQKQINTLQSKNRHEFPEQVKSVLRSALMTDHYSEDQIATLFSMPSRTLSRRLEDHGTGFRELVEECRFDIARQMLECTSLNVDQISASLNYSRSSSFIRAFKRWSGSTPALWRATHTDDA